MPNAQESVSLVICKQENRYIGWPSVGRRIDGEILAVFSGDRDAHVCPFGKTQLVRSRDGGYRWSDPETINNTPLDDRDAGIVVLASGEILVSWFTSLAFEGQEARSRLGALDLARWDRHAARITKEQRRRWLGNWTVRSTDGGWTWEEPVRTVGSAPHGPTQLADGRLLYLGCIIHGKPGLTAEESTDQGHSWRVIGKVPVPSDKDVAHLYEPHVCQLADGNLVGLFRYQPPGEHSRHHLQQTESDDGGKTWSRLHTTPMWGHPPHLTRLKDGRLLATYGYRRPPYGQRACLSADGGATWDIGREIVIRDDAPSADLGYPASVEMEGGAILTVYYQQEYAGEKTSLMATRWQLPQ